LEVRVISDISDNRQIEFGACPQGDNVRVTLRPWNASRTITCTSTADVSTLKIGGCANFTITGELSNSLSGSRNLTISKSSNNGQALSVNGARNFRANRLQLNGANHGLVINNTRDFNLDSNRIVRARDYALLINNQSVLGTVSNNIFGGQGNLEVISNGVGVLDASSNITFEKNIVHSLYSDNESIAAFRVRGFFPREDLNLRFVNNMIGSMLTTSTKSSNASVFDIENASNVKIYHNTAMVREPAVFTRMQNYTQAYLFPTNSVSIISKNNLFNILVSSDPGFSMFTQYVRMSVSGSPFIESDYNVYNGMSLGQVFARYTDTKDDGMLLTFSQWQSRNFDRNSSVASEPGAHFTSSSDYHTDGGICGFDGMMVPLLDPGQYPGSDVDIDGPRGQDPLLPNITTAGADEAFVNISGSENLPDSV
jgi:hypothetical protein